MGSLKWEVGNRKVKLGLVEVLEDKLFGDAAEFGEFLDGDELGFFLGKGALDLRDHFLAIALLSACHPLNILGVNHTSLFHGMKFRLIIKYPPLLFSSFSPIKGPERNIEDRGYILKKKFIINGWVFRNEGIISFLLFH